MSRNDTDLGGPDAEAALRDIMSMSVSDIRMPSGLADRAVGRDRRRRARIRLTGAVSAVAAAAAVAAAIIVPGQLGGRQAPGPQTAGAHVQTAALVLSRAAAAQVDSSHLISVDHGPGGVTYTNVATQQQRFVSSKLDSSGQPYFQMKTEVNGSSYKQTDVEYQHQVWSTLTGSSVDHGWAVTISPVLPLQTDNDPVTAFQQALKAGTATVIGHRSLNGRDTILLRVKAPSNKAGDTRAAALPPDYVWLDSSSYLVVQTESFDKATRSPILQQITWLPPTPENLALLTLTPPAGFTQIPDSEMGQKYLGPIS
jgi:hypothetical protein